MLSRWNIGSCLYLDVAFYFLNDLRIGSFYQSFCYIALDIFRQLRNNNNANVRVPDCEGPERVMNIQVDDAQTAINVIEQVNLSNNIRDTAEQNLLN